jgi:hypothetical protein
MGIPAQLHSQPRGGRAGQVRGHRQPQIPVGIDGESVLMPTPVRCTIRPLALRVQVPRSRPGVPAPPPQLDWARLRRQALTVARTADPAPGRERKHHDDGL